MACVTRLRRGWVIALCGASVAAANVSSASDNRFSVRDGIELTEFTSPGIGITGQPLFSPDGRQVAFLTARGVMETNVLEYTVWLWSSAEIAQALRTGRRVTRPIANPLVRVTTRDSRSAIADLRWLPDSKGLVYRAEVSKGQYQLFAVDVATGRAVALSGDGQNVGEADKFEVRNGNVLYTVVSPSIRQTLNEQNEQTAVVGTASTLRELAFERDEPWTWVYDWVEIWVLTQGGRVSVQPSGVPAPLHGDRWRSGQRALALSPNGRQIVASLPVESVPTEWEAFSPRIKAGTQPLNVKSATGLVSQFMMIDVRTGRTTPVLDAPDGLSVGYSLTPVSVDWSADGRFLALANTYMPVQAQIAATPKRPCLAVVELATRSATCLERINGPEDEDYRVIGSFQFDPSDSTRLLVRDAYVANSTSEPLIRVYRRIESGHWKFVGVSQLSPPPRTPFEVAVEQSPNDPPKLVARDGANHLTVTLLDPNAPLRKLQLGVASSFNWRDRANRSWRGILVMPPDFVPGKPYPLVIQTHGYPEGTLLNSWPAEASRLRSLLGPSLPAASSSCRLTVIGRAAASPLRRRWLVSSMVMQPPSRDCKTSISLSCKRLGSSASV
jgi:dipeptidyl aminopeptidase/acylaminoacyl peptidase